MSGESVRGRLRDLEHAYEPQAQERKRVSIVALLQGDREGARLLSEVSNTVHRVEQREPDLRDRHDVRLSEVYERMSDSELKAFRELVVRLNERIELRRQNPRPRWKR
jgi:hypothetical protein